MTFEIQPKELKFNVGWNFQMITIYFCLMCKVSSKIKIQILQFNGILFRGTDDAILKIIILDNKRKEK